jgi:hypothetical protein
MSALAAKVAASAEDVCGMAHARGKNSKVSVMQVAAVFDT